MAYVLKRYDGTSWAPAVKRYWNGTKWVGVDGANDAPEIPETITGLSGWWRTDSLALADGNSVSSWSDESGNGKDVTQGTATAQPIYKVNILNGKPVLRFDGGDALVNTSGIFPAGDHTWFAVVDHTSGTDKWVVEFRQAPGDLGISALARFNSPDRWVGYWRQDGATAGNEISTSDARSTPMLATFKRGSGSHQLRLDGIDVGSVTAAGDMTGGMVTIGGLNGGGSFVGDIAEVLVYSRALTATEIDEVETYINDRWALWTPLPIPRANLQLFLRADSLSLNDGDAVSTWGDDSKNARDATQATAANQPVFVLSAINGKPAVRFDGADDYLRGTAWSFPNNAEMVFMVMNVRAAPAVSDGFFSRGAAGENDWDGSKGHTVEASSPSDKWNSIRNGGDLEARTIRPADGTWAIYEATMNTGTARTAYNKNSGAATDIYTDMGTISPTDYVIAARWTSGAPNPSYASPIDVAEIVCYDTYNAAIRDDVLAYLTNKYGITLT